MSGKVECYRLKRPTSSPGTWIEQGGAKAISNTSLGRDFSRKLFERVFSQPCRHSGKRARSVFGWQEKTCKNDDDAMNDKRYDVHLSRQLKQKQARQCYALPPVNMFLDARGLHLELAVPGYDKSQLELLLDGNVLTVRGKPRASQPREEAQWLRREFVLQGFERVFALPEGVDFDKVQASCENGILRVSFPAARPAQPQSRKIEVG